MQKNQTGKTGLIFTAVIIAAILLFLFGTQTGKNLRSGAEDVTKATMDKAGDVAGAAGTVAKDAAEATGDAANATMHKAGEMADAAGSMAKDAVDATGDAAKSTLHKAGEMADDAMDATANAASATAHKAGEMVKEGVAVTSSAAHTAMDKAGDMTGAAVQSAKDVMNNMGEAFKIEEGATAEEYVNSISEGIKDTPECQTLDAMLGRIVDNSASDAAAFMAIKKTLNGNQACFE